MLLQLFRDLCLPRRVGRHAHGAMQRLEVCPPALAHGAAVARPIGLRGWLGSAWPDRGSAVPHRTQRRPVQRAAPLPAVRSEFGDAIAGIHSVKAAALEDGIRRARSLRELWHLRADVYTLVATDRGEAEAQRRVAHLNRHFTTRSARAGEM